ncbi:TonB-dependent receptor [Sphingopyxis sp.]|uniref:TonB-dependent receptor n=1 Tax=Sphingopyxis sp. TaxID=1908224 RepID=UPI003BAD5D52
MKTTADMRRTRRQLAAAGSAIMLAAILAAPAYAQEAAADVTPAGAEETRGAEDIIVTARRRDERLQDVPIAISAITGDTLREQNITNIQDAAKLVPTLLVGRSSSGAGSVIYMRGIGTGSLSRGFEQSISINIDNVQISRGNAINIGYLDLAQMEILKGPQALFFGKNSPGGIITMTSADPTDELELSVKAGYDFESRQAYGEAVASGPLTDTIGARVAVRASDAQGYFHNDAVAFTDARGLLMGTFGGRYPRQREIAGRLTLQFEPSPDFKARLKLFASKNDAQPVIRQNLYCPNGTPQPVFGVVDLREDCRINRSVSIYSSPAALIVGYPEPRDGVPYTENRVLLTSLDMSYSPGDIDLTSVTAYFVNDQKQYSTFSFGQFGANELQKYSAFSQELRLATDFDFPLNATVGTYYQKTNFPVTNAALFQNTPVDPVTGRRFTAQQDMDLDTRTYSVFGELSLKLGDTIEINGGARATWERKDFDYTLSYVAPALRGAFPMGRNVNDTLKESDVSPQVTIAYKPSRQLTIYGGYRTGYKSGGYNQSQYLRNATTIRDLIFRAETASGFELGAKGQLADGRMTFNVALYDYDYKNLQTLVFDAATVSYNVANAGLLTTRGIEIDTSYNILEGDSDLRVNLAGSYNDAKFHDYVGQCYGGQTIAQGCSLNPNATGVFTGQDYDGRTPPRAPEWSLGGGFNFGTPVGENLRFKLVGDVRYTSSFDTHDALNPRAKQPGYALVNGSVTLGQEENGWELSLIGRNLTNKIIYFATIDQTGQGSGTGTAASVFPDLVSTTEAGRSVSLQFSYRF